MTKQSTTPQSLSQRRQAKGLFWGVALIFLGAWFLSRRMGIDLPGLDQLWPIFPTLSGLTFLVAWLYRSDADPGLVWPGLTAFLVGLFFFFFTFEVFQWDDMERLWPVFPAIAGLSFVATWAAGGFKQPGLLVPGTAALAVGVLGLFFTLGGWTVETVQLVASIVVIVVGAGIVLRALRTGS